MAVISFVITFDHSLIFQFTDTKDSYPLSMLTSGIVTSFNISVQWHQKLLPYLLSILTYGIICHCLIFLVWFIFLKFTFYIIKYFKFFFSSFFFIYNTYQCSFQEHWIFIYSYFNFSILYLPTSTLFLSFIVWIYFFVYFHGYLLIFQGLFFCRFCLTWVSFQHFSDRHSENNFFLFCLLYKIRLSIFPID